MLVIPYSTDLNIHNGHVKFRLRLLRKETRIEHSNPFALFPNEDSIVNYTPVAKVGTKDDEKEIIDNWRLKEQKFIGKIEAHGDGEFIIKDIRRSLDFTLIEVGGRKLEIFNIKTSVLPISALYSIIIPHIS